MSAFLLLAFGPPARDPQPGDLYEIDFEATGSTTSSNGSHSSSFTSNTMREKVLAVREDGLELEYDLPADTTEDDRGKQWEFPARVFRPWEGPMQLLDPAALEKRRDAWLEAGELSAANCGKWFFSWTAYKIECDPQSVIEIIAAVDLRDMPRDGAAYNDPRALSPGSLRREGDTAYVVAMTVNPDVIRSERARTDITVAGLSGEQLTDADALARHASETIAGTIRVRFETDAEGRVVRRIKRVEYKISYANGVAENVKSTEVVTRTASKGASD